MEGYDGCCPDCLKPGGMRAYYRQEEAYCEEHEHLGDRRYRVHLERGGTAELMEYHLIPMGK